MFENSPIQTDYSPTPDAATIQVAVIVMANGPVIVVSHNWPQFSSPVDITWHLVPASQAEWELLWVGIDGSDFGPPSSPSPGVSIQIHDKCTVAGQYKYTIWCAPKGGGQPVVLDPIIENVPN